MSRVFLLDDHEVVRRGLADLLQAEGDILTSCEDDEALFAAIMAGAAGYVLKQIRGADLVDAVRAVRGRCRPVTG